jgi:hypothetical protein
MPQPNGAHIFHLVFAGPGASGRFFPDAFARASL